MSGSSKLWVGDTMYLVDDEVAEYIDRLRDIIQEAGRGAVFVGSIYSGCHTSKRVERMLRDALDEFAPLRTYLHEQKQALAETKP